MINQPIVRYELGGLRQGRPGVHVVSLSLGTGLGFLSGLCWPVGEPSAVRDRERVRGPVAGINPARQHRHGAEDLR